MGGTFSNSFTRKNVRIIMSGLYNAGKTTMLYQLQLGEVVTTIPTIGFNVETINFKKLTVTGLDLGGRCKIRPLTRHFYQNTDAFIFVVDSADGEMIDEAKEQIRQCIVEEKDLLGHVPFAIVCNKQDIKGAMTVNEIYDKLDLGSLMPRDKVWKMFGTSAKTKEGLYDVMEWVCDVARNSSSEREDTTSEKDPKKSSGILENVSSFSKYMEKFHKFFLEM